MGAETKPKNFRLAKGWKGGRGERRVEEVRDREIGGVGGNRRRKDRDPNQICPWVPITRDVPAFRMMAETICCRPRVASTNVCSISVEDFYVMKDMQAPDLLMSNQHDN